MKNIIYLLFLFIYFVINQSLGAESDSIDNLSDVSKASLDPNGEVSRTSASDPRGSTSTQSITVQNSYIDFSDSVLEGRTSSWNRFILQINDDAKKGLDCQDNLLSLTDGYYNSDNPQFVRCSDHFTHEEYPEEFFHLKSNIPVHLPTEVKNLKIISKLKRLPGSKLTDSIRLSNFPRVKNFKKKLVLLPSEPYQRVMSFAIEQCMIPSKWYLELIHCMYFGMAPKFSGMVLSYSLQDIVGAALMSISYKDEHFNSENCFNAVSLVVDDYISPHYKEICESVQTCLESKHFEKYFSKQIKEFESRMESAYSNIALKPGRLEPMQFYRYSVLFSMSLIKDKSIDLKTYPERNFLPIRIALSSLAYYAISTNQGWEFESERAVSIFFTKLILKMLFEVLMISISRCKEKIFEFSKEKANDKLVLFEMFCKEILSAGFVVEAISELDASDPLYSKAVMPQRILDRSYQSFIPDMTRDLDHSKYDNSWAHAQIDFSTPTVERPDTVQRVYRSKKLKKTFKRDTMGNGIGPSQQESACVDKIKTGRMTRMGFKLFTRRLSIRKRN
ncbi:putative secreted protein [Cryptosporidium canis]|uniref:Secreted protein n=1 Tax=Cryptosporidium canis TaxID=195482 RepID=A0A9D5DIM2_9CRYT|nr:putative secreted protein [Cryptosporidium canis]